MVFLAYLLVIAGFVIGLGAVTVIDLHGFLGRHSSYWTEATTRTHKVTKPMIWVGILLVALGGGVLYAGQPIRGVMWVPVAITLGLVLNGVFLSGVVSPYLLKREREGKSAELLPKSFQRKIAVSMIVSDLGWWSLLVLFVWSLSK